MKRTMSTISMTSNSSERFPLDLSMSEDENSVDLSQNDDVLTGNVFKMHPYHF